MDDLLDTAPAGFLGLSDEGIILRVNATLQEWLGYPVGTLPGKPIETILPVSTRIFYQTYISPILKLQGKLEEIYLSLRSFQGNDLAVLINAVRRERAGVWTSQFVIVPMQKRNELENELLRARRAAEEANHQLEKALADVERQKSELQSVNARLSQAMTETHHRVKNNLQLISAMIDLQQSTKRAMVPMEELVHLGANVRALGVIHDILTQEARAGSEQETLSVHTVLQRLISTLQLTIGSRRLAATLDEGRLHGKQATSLALIVNELVANALKHSTGDIEITFTANGRLACLEVRDDGPGFPEDFDVTTRANIGLEIVGNLVAWDLGGSIDYKNRESGGARIIVTFPIY